MIIAPAVAHAGVFSDDQPNLIIICLDTVRYDTFWLPETAHVPDPLTAWTARAVRYREAQSAAPWTVPSVASVVTGRYPLHHNAGRFSAKVANLDTLVPSPLPLNVPTFIESIKGYDTSGVIANPFLARQSRIIRTRYLGLADSENITGAAQVVIDRKNPRPFLLYLHYMDAHGDAFKTAAAIKSALAEIDPALQNEIRRHAPANVCAKNDSSCERYVAYAGATLHMRSYIADIMSDLEEHGHLDDTAVVLFSDHGEEFGEHREEEKALGLDPRAAYGAGHGHSLYQELLHVPLLVWYPGWKPADVDAPVSLVDIAPTVAAWTGVELKTDGIVLPRSNEEASTASRVLLSSGIAYGPEQFAARVGPWKRIVRDTTDRVLYSLRRDPAEKTPYQHASAFREVDDEILKYASATGTVKVEPAAISPEVMKKLQSLGYLTGGKNE